MKSFVSHWKTAYKKVSKTGEDKMTERKEKVFNVATVTIVRILQHQRYRSKM